MASVGDFVTHFERTCPPALAADWDNVGLLAGDPESEVQRVVTCLTLTLEVAEEAIRRSAQLVVSHHPVLFKGTKRITTATPEGIVLLALLRANVAILSPHTAYDNAPDGINEQLAKLLGLVDIVSLRQRWGAESAKLVTFVPGDSLEAVADALFKAGAGRIGQYRECSYRAQGYGTYFGEEGTHPAIGNPGRREMISEWRLEVVCPTNRLHAAIQAVRANHPFEEPAIDVVKLQASNVGEGRIGRLPTPATLGGLALLIKDRLRCGAVQVVGKPTRKLERIAVACGAAGEYLRDAHRAGADAFVTGEMRFHDMLFAQQDDVAAIIPGHYATERFAVETLALRLADSFPGVEVWASEAEADPVVWM